MSSLRLGVAGFGGFQLKPWPHLRPLSWAWHSLCSGVGVGVRSPRPDPGCTGEGSLGERVSVPAGRGTARRSWSSRLLRGAPLLPARSGAPQPFAPFLPSAAGRRFLIGEAFGPRETVPSGPPALCPDFLPGLRVGRGLRGAWPLVTAPVAPVGIHDVLEEPALGAPFQGWPVGALHI